MALRLLEIVLPADQKDALREILDDVPVLCDLRQSLLDGQLQASVLVDADDTGEAVDAIDARFGRIDGFRLIMLPVEGTLPRPVEPEPDPEPEPVPKPEPERKPIVRGLHREELRQDVEDMAKLTRVFVAMLALSVVVTAIGMLRDNVAVIIGGMVIAPLLGPNVALAFGTTLGDVDLIRGSLRTNVIGVAIALALCIAVGVLLPYDVMTPEILARCEVGLSDILLALASGAIGALAVTSAVSSTLVGVMVAVALLPPTVTLGLMIGDAQWPYASSAAVLLAVNIICVNLAGVTTFYLAGIKPRTWYEQANARRGRHRAFIIWIVLLAVLAALISFSGIGDPKSDPDEPAAPTAVE